MVESKLFTAEQFQDQAARFREVAEMLEKVAAQLTVGNGAAVKVRPTGKKAGGKKRGRTRLQQLQGFLQENGPSRRVDIINSEIMPSGSISFLLAKKNGFDQDKDGKWYWPNDSG